MFKKIILTLGLLFWVPLVVDAEGMPGARSATNAAGDVFLGGNYIEVGISKSGTYGTSIQPSDLTKWHTLSNHSNRLGLLADGDGWDVGDDPTSGDFFLPGGPYEGYIFTYTMNGNDYRYNIAERSNLLWGTNASVDPVVEDQSDISKNKLKAHFSVTTKENVVLEMTIEFGVDDIYYSTLVEVTNKSRYPISNVSFARDLDPDNDKDLQGTFDTYNKVICNPNPNEDGSDTNYAMVVARGPYTNNGFFFVSFDNRAKGSINYNAPQNLLTYATDESLELVIPSEDANISGATVNGYVRNDTLIQITTKLNDLDNGASDNTIFYSSLDPNVIQSISKILKAVAAKVKGLSDTRIEVETQEGYEYSIDNGEHWQDSGVFEGLEPGKEYKVLSRIKATGTDEASEPEEISITTKNSSKATPDVIEVIVTEDEITIETKEGYEYSIDGGKTWQKSSTFTGLTPDTEYTIIARYKETSTDMAGKVTDPIVVRTSKKIATALDDVTNVDVEVEVGAESVGITIHKGLLYEAVMDDEEVKEIVDAGHDARIVFDVEAVTLTEEELAEIKEQVSEDEVAFVVDAKLKLYADGAFVKDLTSSGKKITFTIKVPKEYVKKGRNFSIVRKHVNEEGYVEYEVLKDEDNDDSTITISSDKFSEFTVVYNDLVNPKTGDNVLVYFFTLLISAGAILILNKFNRKEV